MKVFITWSGDRSKAIAEALHEWLPSVIQAVDPWISISDIDKGARWMEEIARHLEQADVGVVCLTSENLESPWLLFEVGALSKALLKDEKKPLVCTYLLDLEPKNVALPLGQFQHTKAEKEDTRKLMHTINRALGDKALSAEKVDETFDLWWPKLEKCLNSIPPQEQPERQRSTEEMLEEILAGIRSLLRTPTIALQQIMSQEGAIENLRGWINFKDIEEIKTVEPKVPKITPD